jgi:hypothetical protein
MHTAYFTTPLARVFARSVFLYLLLVAMPASIFAQGTWTQVTTPSPNYNEGVMLLLTDGRVMAKTSYGGASYGNTWDILTPDATGSYINGTWTSSSPMFDTRLYFSTQILKNGNVYVAGGEYGTGKGSSEIYNPYSDIWTTGPALPPTDSIYDGNSVTLPDGRILQGIVSHGGQLNFYYDPIANTYTPGPSCIKSHDESSWVKLKDNSILFVDYYDTTTERYIPTLNRWVKDGNVPIKLYDTIAGEIGAGFLLPDGRAFFLGASGNTAYYTPTGDTTKGTWVAGPKIPNNQSTPDAAAAMMVNGKILCAVSGKPTHSNWFPSPTSYYEFDYVADSFKRIKAPDGNDTLYGPCFYSNMLNLPDGSILYSSQASNFYFVYTPDGSPLAAGKPTIDKIIKQNCDTYLVTGTLFNGITEGSAYGDDWQMATNYPIVRLSSGSNVYYATTYNWNRTGVQTGSLPDTAEFVLPYMLPTGTYSLVVSANGNASNPISFSTCGVGIEKPETQDKLNVMIYPNPASTSAKIIFDDAKNENLEVDILDMYGRIIKHDFYKAVTGKNSYTLNIQNMHPGIYTVLLKNDVAVANARLVIK